MKKVVFVEGKLGSSSYCGDCGWVNDQYGSDYGKCTNPRSPYYGEIVMEYNSCNEA